MTGGPAPSRPAGTAALLLGPLVAVVTAGAVALAAAFATFFLMTALAGDGDPSGWDDLGRVVLAMLVFALVGAVAWAVALTVAARRLLPPGRRLLGGLGSGVAVAAWVVVAWLTRAAGEGADLPVLPAGIAVLPVALVLPSLVFWLVGRRRS